MVPGSYGWTSRQWISRAAPEPGQGSLGDIWLAASSWRKATTSPTQPSPARTPRNCEHGHGLRPMRAVLVRASQDIGVLAADFIRANGATIGGITGRLMRRLASGADDPNKSDLLSYLLFDGRFARQLIDLGWNDARARHDELCELFEAQHRPE